MIADLRGDLRPPIATARAKSRRAGREEPAVRLLTRPKSQAILWLASDECAYTTGTFIEIAGGKKRPRDVRRALGGGRHGWSLTRQSRSLRSRSSRS